MLDYTVYNSMLLDVILVLKLTTNLKNNYLYLPVQIFANNQSGI